MKNGDVIVIVTVGGVEVIGKIHSDNPEVLELEDACILPELDHLDLMAYFVYYWSQPKILFYWNSILASYEPRQSVIDLYNKIITHPMKDVVEKYINKTIEEKTGFVDHLAKVDWNSVQKEHFAAAEIFEAAAKAMADKMAAEGEIKVEGEPTPPIPPSKVKVTTLQDIMANIDKKAKRKMN